MLLNKYSLGTGDRFGQQGSAQLKAIQQAKDEHGLEITPVWNKSQREHEIIGTSPQEVRGEADRAIQALGWKGSYCVDADHITKTIVDPYIPCSNFFTIDVAEYIGEKSNLADKEVFLQKNVGLIGEIAIPDIEDNFEVTESFLSDWADQYLCAIHQAREIYEYILERKSEGAVFEISMDEVETPQTPLELYFILKAVAEQGIKINTIAPKFTGNFYKGIDYVGNIGQFVKEFEQDLLVISHAVDQYDLPADLKLSIHSGSDKFSLYPYIHKLLKKHNTGIHLKTSGTTWLEELIGLAETGNEGLKMVIQIYREAYNRYEELIAPYKPVININRDELPIPADFADWSGNQLADALTHDPENPAFDSQLRQFLHCSYKIAAERNGDFIKMLQENADKVGVKVTHNLYERHIKPLFAGG